MNIKLAILSAGLTAALSVPLTAQQPHDEFFGSITKVSDLTNTIETSTVVASVEGPYMNLWLLTRKVGVVITRDENGKLRGLTETAKPTPVNTYLMMLDITDTEILKQISDARATVLVVSPDDKSNSLDFKASNGGFGCTLTLPWTGEYRFTVIVYAGKLSRTTHFLYAVK